MYKKGGLPPQVRGPSYHTCTHNFLSRPVLMWSIRRGGEWVIAPGSTDAEGTQRFASAQWSKHDTSKSYTEVSPTDAALGWRVWDHTNTAFTASDLSVGTASGSESAPVCKNPGPGSGYSRRRRATDRRM